MIAPEARYCEQCGFEFSTDARFCGGCGRPRASTAFPATLTTNPNVISWRSTDADVDLDDYPYASAGRDAFLTAALMLGAISSTNDDGDSEYAPPMGTTWLGGRDEGVVGRCDQEQLGLVAQVFGEFVESLGLLDGPWDAIEVQTPLDHHGLIMVSVASGAESADLRIMVPIAFGVEPTDRHLGQIKATIDWLLNKMESPYMSYVPLVDDDSQRGALLDMLIERSGHPQPGPLSDPDWLASPYISAIESNAYGFPGAGALRIGVVDEAAVPRQRAVLREGVVELIDLAPGTVDLYAGWQIGASGVGMLGLTALGHRSLMGLIDAISEVPDLARELGGVPPSA